jgi:hypothetical protein
LEDEKLKSIVSEFTKQLEFRSNPTPQMIAAFPIFWNHRWQTIESKLEDKVEFKVYTNFTDGNMKTFEVDGLNGTTTLELYAPLLFDEPPLSDTLNFEIMYVLTKHVDATDKVRQKYAGVNNMRPEGYVKAQQEIIQRDIVIFNLLRVLKGIFEDQNWLADRISLAGGDRAFQVETKTWRVALNGYAPEFASFLRFRDSFCLSEGDPAGNGNDLQSQFIPQDRYIGKLHVDYNDRETCQRDRFSRQDIKRMSEKLMRSMHMAET